MTERFYHLAARGISLSLDLAVGHIRRLMITRDGRTIEPLHTAPWVDDSAIQADEAIPPNVRALSGDFFCAPFGLSDVEAAPPHGWPANSGWSLVESVALGDGVTARFRLDRLVMGSSLIKEMTLRDNHPFVYQRHILTGGAGAVSSASHAMTRFAIDGHLSFSPKRFAETPAAPLESDPALGRSRFATARRFEDLSRLPFADGSFGDLRHYPIADRHEDFVALVEAADSPLGWTAAVRGAEDDIMLSLKDPRDYPVTFLWISNGGRDYSPWNGRHLGVLGIEEARAYGAFGHAASIAPNDWSNAGVPTSVDLSADGVVEARHVIGGVPRPAGWGGVSAIESNRQALTLTSDEGSSIFAPYDGSFLQRPQSPAAGSFDGRVE